MPCTMFSIRSKYIRRISFISKLFPKIPSTLGLDLNSIKSTDQFDGELFCGGRSKNKDLLTHFGFVQDSGGNKSFIQLPIFRRSLKKLTKLVEHEIELAGGQQVLLPTLIPQALWTKSKRLERQRDALDSVYRLTNNDGDKFILGPTFEEAITQVVSRVDLINEHSLPLMLYQTSQKFRYEPNPKFGLLRNHEFIMNDLYTFDANLKEASKTYELISGVYARIFGRLGLDFIKTEGDPGNIGGKYSHEYHLLVASGEDTVIKCNVCQALTNRELLKKQEVFQCPKCNDVNIEQYKALELGHTFLLSTVYSEPLGATFVNPEKGRQSLEMGCFGLGLTRIIGGTIDLLSVIPSDQSNHEPLQLRWPSEVEPFRLGVVAPAKRSQLYHAGSSVYTEDLVNHLLDSTQTLDILVEDRDKEGIATRLAKLMSMGLPNILVIGQGLSKDPIELEFHTLRLDKKGYEKFFYSPEQLIDCVRAQDKLLTV